MTPHLTVEQKRAIGRSRTRGLSLRRTPERSDAPREWRRRLVGCPGSLPALIIGCPDARIAGTSDFNGE